MEYQGKPYCEPHYNEIAGKPCALCFNMSQGKGKFALVRILIIYLVVTAAGKKWCESHFICIGCHKNLTTPGQKFLEWDAKITCTKCYDEIPSGIRRKVLKYIDKETKLIKKMTLKKK